MRVSVGVAALSLVSILAACGGAAHSAAPATAPAPSDTSAAVAAASGAGSTTTVDANGRRAQLQAYRDCLAQHGVTLPSVPQGAGNGGPPTSAGDVGATPPSFDPNGTGQPPAGDPAAGGGRGGFGNLGSILQDPANADAVKACASLAPQGGFGGGQGGQGGQRGQALQAYQSCLKDHGVEVPTTVAGGPPVSIDRTTPAFAAANEVCQALLPQRNGGTTTTTVGA